MIGLRRGEGGWLRRLAGEIVPLGVGLVAGQLAGAFLGLWLGIATGLMAWAFVSGLLVAVRRRPRLRRAYRILLLLHVAFWSARGVVETSDFAGPDAPVPGHVVAWEGATTFRAGVGEATFELPARATLAGWGQRPRRRRLPAFGGLGLLGRLSLWSMGPPATGAPPRSPLFVRPSEEGEALGARALLLVPDAGGPAFAVVRLDLIALDDRLAWDVLEAVGQRARAHARDAARRRDPHAQRAGRRPATAARDRRRDGPLRSARLRRGARGVRPGAAVRGREPASRAHRLPPVARPRGGTGRRSSRATAPSSPTR